MRLSLLGVLLGASLILYNPVFGGLIHKSAKGAPPKEGADWGYFKREFCVKHPTLRAFLEDLERNEKSSCCENSSLKALFMQKMELPEIEKELIKLNAYDSMKLYNFIKQRDTYINGKNP